MRKYGLLILLNTSLFFSQEVTDINREKRAESNTSKKISVTGEQVFYSLNPKTDLDIVQQDMVTLDYGSLLALEADLSGGIKGTIDKPGGKINVEVYAYDKDRDDGIQKLILSDPSDHSGRNKLVYGVYSDITSIDTYIGKTVKVPYGFALNKNDGSFEALGETDSNDVKLLGANSRSGWDSDMCDYNFLRGLLWLGWKTASFYNYGKPVHDPPCQKVITQLQTGKQPVVIKITIKDATLYEVKIPGVTENVIEKLVEGTEGPQEYKIIKKLKVTVLEAPDEFREADFYTEEIGNYIKEVNTYYTAKTGNTKSAAITAEIGNPRILFKDVDLIIKKGSRKSYNFQSDPQVDVLVAETGLEQNDDETLQLIYIHTVLHPANQKKNIIQGYTYNDGDMINNDHFCIFSYSTLFDIDIKQAGTPGCTLAHEIGHYFGLSHTFSGGCSQINGGDKVADTPPAVGEHWYVADMGTPQEHLLENPCQNAPLSCNGVRRQIENLMDYGPCRWLFTKGQVERINNRIKTKPTLFRTVRVHDASVDPHQININVADQRHNNSRMRRSVANDAFAVRMLYPDAQNGNYNLEVVADEPEKATIRIFDIYATLLYEEERSVAKGRNQFPIPSLSLKKEGLYLLTYIGNTGNTAKIKFLRYR